MRCAARAVAFALLAASAAAAEIPDRFAEARAHQARRRAEEAAAKAAPPPTAVPPADAAPPADDATLKNREALKDLAARFREARDHQRAEAERRNAAFEPSGLDDEAPPFEDDYDDVDEYDDDDDDDDDAAAPRGDDAALGDDDVALGDDNAAPPDNTNPAQPGDDVPLGGADAAPPIDIEPTNAWPPPPREWRASLGFADIQQRMRDFSRNYLKTPGATTTTAARVEVAPDGSTTSRHLGHKYELVLGTTLGNPPIESVKYCAGILAKYLHQKGIPREDIQGQLLPDDETRVECWMQATSLEPVPGARTIRLGGFDSIPRTDHT